MVIGLLSALILHLILRTFVFLFNLDRPSVPKPKDRPARGHDVKSYRAAREKKQRQAEKEANVRLTEEQRLLQEQVLSLRTQLSNVRGDARDVHVRHAAANSRVVWRVRREASVECRGMFTAAGEMRISSG